MGESKRYLVWENGSWHGTFSAREVSAVEGMEPADFQAIPEQEARLAPKAWEALRFYADARNWLLQDRGPGGVVAERFQFPIKSDGGARAQAALRALEGEEGQS